MGKLAPDKLSEITAHMAVFVLPENAQHLPIEILIFLIEQSFVLSDNSDASTLELKELINKIFYLEFAVEEIDKVIKTTSTIIQTPQGKYQLKPERLNSLRDANKNNKAIEEKIYYSWAGELKEKHSGLTIEDINQIVNDLRLFFAKLLLRYGAACASILYDNKNTIVDFCDEGLFSALPRRKKEIEKIRHDEIITFFKKSSLDDARRKLIFDQLNASFLYRIISIEPSCSKYIQSVHFIDDEIYLDCNFVFSLLGLNGEERKNIARELIKTIQAFKFNIYVTEKTSEEYLTSLNRSRAFLKNSRMPSRKVLKVATPFIREDPSTVYWKEYANTGIGLDEFFNIYSGIDSQLRTYNIQIIKRDMNIVSAEELYAETEKMKYAIPEKAPYLFILEHDAFCILYVLKKKSVLIGKGNKAFFLTEDHPLMNYEKKRSRFLRQESVCILPYQLMQLLRPLLPRTSDFEKAFIKAVTQPILRSQNLLPSDIASIILGRFSLYKNQPLQIVPKLLTNSYITNQLKYIERTNTEKADALIDNLALAEAKILIDEKDADLKREVSSKKM